MSGKTRITMVILSAIVLALGLTLIGCGKAKAKPEITSLSPTSGEPGVEVVITGGSFGTTQGLGVVHFGTAIAEVVAWSDISITVKVPSGLAAADCDVTVETEAGASNAAQFAVTQKQETSVKITSLKPESGPPGSEVVVSGSNFGKTQGSGKVLFGKGQAEVTAWSDTSISIKIPANSTANTYGVTVETGAGKSNEAVFKVVGQEDLGDQKKAVVAYLQSKGESTAGSDMWTLALVKQSSQDSNWEVIKVTLPDAKTLEAILIFNNMAAAWECLSTAGPPWTGVEFKGESVPSDLKNV